MLFKRTFTLLLVITHGISIAFQPPVQKYPQVQIAPHKKTTWQAARQGDLPTLRTLLARHPEWVNSRERYKNPVTASVQEGLTPLAWAVINNHMDVVKFLISMGADVHFKDNDQTILHMAARTGNRDLVKYLLDHGANTDINAIISQKGRTPLAEVLRASKDGIIHLSIENEDIQTREAFLNALPSALKQLTDKESKKLSTQQMIPIIKLFIENGATANPTDATGRTMAYYINEVQLVSEPDRISLLRAVSAPETSRLIKFNENNLPEAILRLQKFAGGFPQFAAKINTIIWTIQEAQKEYSTTQKYNLLRVAMALLSKLKELIHHEKNISEEFFKKLEPQLDEIRTILRDTALIISRKALLTPKATIPPAPAVQSSAPVKEDLNGAIIRLQKLAGGLERFGVGPKIRNAIQIIEAAQNELNSGRKLNSLQEAFKLIGQIKEEIRKALPDQFSKIEPHINSIRKIVVDESLIASGKIPAPGNSPATPQVPQSAHPIITRPPIETPPPAAIIETSHLLNTIINKSSSRINYIGNFDGLEIKSYLNPRSKAPINKVIDNGWLTFIGLGTINFSIQGITTTTSKGITTTQEEWVDIVIDSDNSLSVQPGK